MPAMLDDPMSPTIYRTSGTPPYPDPHDPHPALPADIVPRQVTLRDRVTIATILPFSSSYQVPPSLLAYLSDQLNKEIEGGDTYPMVEPLPHDKFASYWFQNFGAVMVLGNIQNVEDVVDDWPTVCLGSFYIKPNYPGRSSHVCNAGFLVTDAARNRGVGRLMGEAYIDWAPKLGYTYSVFNLVYETNVASCRIWDALGFKRIGRVKGCGNLKSYPGQLIDAIIYGRDLGPEAEDLVSEERFDKIKFYLKFGKYPNGADRAEKSRLRSAATHYKLVDGDKLMLKDKEVISDPKRQYEIAKKVHVAQHGGINKTTATIAECYHWIRIKETASLVIRDCDVCKEMGKLPTVRADGVIRKRVAGNSHGQGGVSAAGRLVSLPTLSDLDSNISSTSYGDSFNNSPTADIHSASDPLQHMESTSPLHHMESTSSPQSLHLQGGHQPRHNRQHHHHHHLHHHHARRSHTAAPTAQMHQHQHQHSLSPTDDYIALDPQIMEDVRNHLGNYIDDHEHIHDHDHDHDHDHQVYSNLNPFQGMLGTPHPDEPHVRHHDHDHSHAHDEDGMGDGDGGAGLDMLIEDEDETDLDDMHHSGGGDDDVGGRIGDDGDGDGDGDGDEDGGVEDIHVRVQAQMAARAAQAAMRDGLM